MKIIPLIIILALSLSAAGDGISEILDKKLEVKQDQTKNEQALDNKLTEFSNMLKDGTEVELTDKTGKAKIRQSSKNRNIEIDVTEGNPIKKIKLNNVRGQNHTLKIDTPQIPFTKQAYAIDPSEINFTDGEIEIIAKGNQLYKCPTWNYTTGICEQVCEIDEETLEESCNIPWIYQRELTPGESYTVPIYAGDPAFYETATVIDVALSPVNETAFLVAFIDNSQLDASVRIINTNGSVIINTTDIDTSVTSIARIDASMINSTDFVVSWINGTGFLFAQQFRFNTTTIFSTTATITVDNLIGTNTDNAIAMLSDRYAVCYANDNDDDADFKIYSFAGAQLVAETNVDANILPEATLQNLIDCAGVNGSRFAYAQFDDNTVNDMSFALRNSDGTQAVAQTDIDTDVGETAQVALASLEPNNFGMVFYDSTDQDITIAIRSGTNAVILAPLDIDTNAGAASRVAAGTVRRNSTDTEDLLVAAWQNTADNTIKAAVYFQNGTAFTAPFNVTTTVNASFQLIDVLGRDPIISNQFCPARFIVAFSNSSGAGEFKRYIANGSTWSGVCIDNAGPALSNADPEGRIFSNTQPNISIAIDAEDATDVQKVEARITLPNGTLQTRNLTLSSGMTYTGNFSIPGLIGRYNLTFFANDSLGNQNTHITFFEVGLPIEGIKVQRGFVSETASVINVTINSTPTNSTFIYFTSATTNNPPNEWQTTGDMINSTLLRFETYAVSALNISYAAIHSPELRVQRGTLTFASGNDTAIVTLTSVNTTETFVLVHGRCDSGTNGNARAGFFLGNLTNSTRLEIRRGNAGNCAATASYQVVSWPNSRVQRVSGSIPSLSASFSQTINQSNNNAVFATVSWASIGTDAGQDTNLLQARLDDSGKNVIVSHQPTALISNSNRDAVVYVVELPGATTQNNEVALTNDVNVTVNSVDLDRSFIALSWYNNLGGQKYSNSRVTPILTNSTNIFFFTSTPTGTNTIRYFLTETPQRCLGTINTSTTLTKNITAILFQGESCITINTSNIELNCNGNSITGSQTGNGIFSQNRNNITIRNCRINNFETNILLNGASDSRLINNTILNATRGGIRQIDSSRNNHTQNAYNNQIGQALQIIGGTNNTITNTILQTSFYEAAVVNQSSSINKFTNVTVNAQSGRGMVLLSTNGDQILGGQVNATNSTGILAASPNIIINGTQITTESGPGIEITSTNITVNHTKITATSANGILTNSASNLSIDNTQINVTTGNAIGMVLAQTTNVTNSNLFASTSGNAFLLFVANTTTISNSNLTTNSGSAYVTFAATVSTAANNNIRSNTGFGINLDATSVGNNFTNLNIQSNNTWIRTTAASSGNSFTNITYQTIHGSIRIIPSGTVPINTTINTSGLNVTFNRTFLNDTNFTFFNLSSQITLHGLNFTQAFAVIDRTDNGTFVPCSSPTCINQSYNGSTFIFNVTGHSSYAAIGNSPPTIHNATIVPSVVRIGNNVCFILNVTDPDGITNVTAIIDPPIGANQTLTLDEGLSCNSVPGDDLWTNIYFPIFDAAYIWGTANITDSTGVMTTHAINVSFDALLSFPSVAGIFPPTFAAYTNGTNFNVSLINVSDNVSATQIITANQNTFMFFNWTQFNFSDEQVKNAVVIIEHAYSNTSILNVSLDQFNGSAWLSRCGLNISQTDTTDFCNITAFVNSTTLNNLQLRLNASATSNRTQNVDLAVLNLTTNTPPIITHNINQTYLLNQTALLRVNVTDPETDAIIRVNATVVSPNGTIFLYNLSNLTNANITWDAIHTDMRLKGTYNVTIRATDNTSSTRVVETFFIRRAFNIIDIIEPKEDGVPTLQNFTFHNYTTIVAQNQSNILRLSINISGAEVKQINITGYNDSSPYSIIELSDDEENAPKAVSFTGYEINPEGLDFTNATLLLNASGNSTLHKCSNYNFTDGSCFEGNWTEHLNITKGQLYTVTINSTDPAFIETTAAGDVAMDPLNNTLFLIGFVDIAQTDVSFEIIQTNGSIIINTTDVDTTVTTNARVDVNWINSTDFVIFWADTSSNDATFQIWRFNGTNATNTTGEIDVDTSMGNTNVDVSIAMLDNRFITCYANDADSDADFKAYNFAGTEVVGETAVDINIQPSSPLQNLIDCSSTNATRWTYFTFDDRTVNDATYYILDNTGATIVGATDIDTDVGETGQVAVMGLNGNLSGLVWYDSTDQDVTMAGVNNSGTTIFGPTDVDTDAGTESRVAAAGVRQNKTSTDEMFAFAWWSQSNGTIKSAVYLADGTQFTAPFNVSTSINSTFPIIDITGKDNITGQEICPGAFLVAFSNGSTGTFLGFWVNGTPWNGTCPVDLIATQLNTSDLNPDELENVTFNGSIFNNGTSTAFNLVAALVDGNCTTGTMIQNTTINLSAGFNATVNFSWSAFPVGPHNISFCVNYINNVLEDNYTNNNITITINVKAYNDYFGNLTGNVTLDTNTNATEYDWRFNDSGNVIFTNSQVIVNFSALYALGRNTSGGIAVNDFLEADQALNMTGFNDSIQTLWATNASHPRQTTTFVVRGRTIDNVPFINSTNTSSFITGILWQSVNSTSFEFNATQRQPLLFVTKINQSQQGFYGTYDYETHVPVLLRSYNSTSNALQYFVELR